MQGMYIDVSLSTRYCTQYNGVLRIPRMNGEPSGQNEAVDYTPFLGALANLPGTDPVLLRLEGQERTIPPQGWFVVAEVAPGAMYTADIYHYVDNNLRIDEPLDARMRDGKVHAKFSLKDYAWLTLAFRGNWFEPIPDLASTGVMLPSNVSETNLESGKLLTEINLAEAESQEIVYQDVTSLDISWFIEEQASAEHDSRVKLPVVRVTEHPAEFINILRGIGQAAGMGGHDIDVLVAHTTSKLGL